MFNRHSQPSKGLAERKLLCREHRRAPNGDVVTVRFELRNGAARYYSGSAKRDTTMPLLASNCTLFETQYLGPELVPDARIVGHWRLEQRPFEDGALMFSNGGEHGISLDAPIETVLALPRYYAVVKADRSDNPPKTLGEDLEWSDGWHSYPSLEEAMAIAAAYFALEEHRRQLAEQARQKRASAFIEDLGVAIKTVRAPKFDLKLVDTATEDLADSYKGA